MSYIVIRTIKGRQYRYRQRSYRDGGRVRTISEYLGPVGNAGKHVQDLAPKTTPRRKIFDPPFDPESVLRDMEAREAAAKARALQVYVMLGVTPPSPGDPIPIEKPTPVIGALMTQTDLSAHHSTPTPNSIGGVGPEASDAVQG